MPKKTPPRDKSAPPREIKPTKPVPRSAEALAAWKRRRNRRMIVIGLLALSFPILELVAYRYRAITVTFANKTPRSITDLKFVYSGGDLQIPEIKPGDAISRVIVPDFSFTKADFSTYRTTIQFITAGKDRYRMMGRAGTIDFSAHETYSLLLAPPDGQFDLKHTTYPGFPLGAIRDLLRRLGLG